MKIHGITLEPSIFLITKDNKRFSIVDIGNGHLAYPSIGMIVGWLNIED